MPLVSDLRLDGRRSRGVGAFGGDVIVVSDRGGGSGNLSDRGRGGSGNLSDGRASGNLSTRGWGGGNLSTCGWGSAGSLSHRWRWLGSRSDRSNGVGAQRECHDPDEDDSGHAAGDDDLARCLGVHIEILSWFASGWGLPRSTAAVG
jgi:hypothetical protein